MQKFMGKEYEGLEEGDYNPQSEIRYKTPEELELSKSSEEELLNFIGDIKNGRTDFTAAEEPIVLKWVKEELEKRKNPKKEEPKSLDAIKDNFTPPGAKGEEESNPQAEVRYKTPEDLMIPTMSDEDLANSIDGIERGQSDLTDAEKPIALGWIKDEMKKRKSAIDTNDNGKIETDEMADFQKSLDDYAAKNPKGREDIPATYKR